MGPAQQVKRYTPQEYYELEQRAEYKSDYYRGEIFAIAEGSARHAKICANLTAALNRRLREECAEYSSDLRLKVAESDLRCYPDVSVYCGPLEFDPEDPSGQTALNPTVLVEVLSKTTEAYDRGTKVVKYRRIPTLRAYLIVSQDSPHVEMHVRHPNDTWLLSEADGMGGQVTVSPINVILPMSEIYAKVDFSTPEE